MVFEISNQRRHSASPAMAATMAGTLWSVVSWGLSRRPMSCRIQSGNDDRGIALIHDSSRCVWARRDRQDRSG